MHETGRGELMGNVILAVFICILGACFCIYNWWFQHEKFKRLLEDQKKKIGKFNTPFAWGCYSIVFILALLAIITYFIFVMMQGIKNIQY